MPHDEKKPKGTPSPEIQQLLMMNQQLLELCKLQAEMLRQKSPLPATGPQGADHSFVPLSPTQMGPM